MLKPRLTVKTRRRRTNVLWLVGIFSFLIVIGMENILSSTFVLDGGSTVYGYLLKQLVFLFIGLLTARGIWHLAISGCAIGAGSFSWPASSCSSPSKPLASLSTGPSAGWAMTSYRSSHRNLLSWQPSSAWAAALTFFWDCHGEKAAIIGRFVKKLARRRVGDLFIEEGQDFQKLWPALPHPAADPVRHYPAPAGCRHGYHPFCTAGIDAHLQRHPLL